MHPAACARVGKQLLPAGHAKQQACGRLITSCQPASMPRSGHSRSGACRRSCATKLSTLCRWVLDVAVLYG